jgi:hypothetical protein
VAVVAGGLVIAVSSYSKTVFLCNIVHCISGDLVGFIRNDGIQIGGSAHQAFR